LRPGKINLIDYTLYYDQILKESERKEQDYVKQAAESRRLFERELAKLGIECVNQSTMNLNLELASVVDAQLAPELKCLEELQQALAYFDHFSKFNGFNFNILKLF
jgi:hypothetical protein